MTKKILGIDAINIRNGGGVTHLVELLNNCEPYLGCFEKVIIWSKRTTLNDLPDFDWIEKRHSSYFEKSLVFRVLWQKFKLRNELKLAGVNLLFLPGSGYISKNIKFVTMCRNVLPFDNEELEKYKYSLNYFKFKILKYIQVSTFNKSLGLIFLNSYAQEFIGGLLKQDCRSTIIPHGCNEIFFKQNNNNINTEVKTYVYVSRLEPYKNHLQLLQAVNQLQLKNFKLSLIGPLGYRSEKILNFLEKNSYLKNNVNYLGEVKHKELSDIYKSSQIGIFLSSCENLPNILIEKMASGLPIISSNKRPMTDILSDSNILIDELSVEEIKEAINTFHHSSELSKISTINQNDAAQFSWKMCAKKTFNYLNFILKEL